MKRNFVTHIWRGCGYLPGVGDHPGTGMVIMFILLSAAACATSRPGGLFGFFVGLIAMSALMLPIYFYGAYDRSKISDRMVAKDPTLI